MAKIYTFEELQTHFPTVDAVARARDRVKRIVSKYDADNNEKRGYSSRFRRAVVYGSSVWGLHPEIGDQHKYKECSDLNQQIFSTHEENSLLESI